MASVTPIILTSVLPFGLNDSGTKFRFSICIDIKNYYPDGVEPEENKLLAFFLNYGSKENKATSIHTRLVQAISMKNIKLDVAGTLMEVSLCFKEFESVEDPWMQLLYNGETSQIGSYTIPDTQSKLGKYQPNKIARLGIESFTLAGAPEPHGFIQKIVGNAERIKSTPNDTWLKDLQQDIGEFSRQFSHVNRNLKAISAYSDSENEAQALDVMMEYDVNKNNKHNEKHYSVERIYDTFSFISSNVLLQRFFGLTIDVEVDAALIRAQAQTSPIFPVKLADPNKVVADILRDSGGPLVSWEHLQIPMQYLNVKSKGEAVIVQKGKEWSDKNDLCIRNYDVSSKLKNMEAINDRIENYIEKLRNAEHESERYRIMKEVLSVDSAALTRGMNIYYCKDGRFDNLFKDSKSTILSESEVIRGHRFGVLNRKKEGINSLGRRKVSVTGSNGQNVNLPEVFRTQEFCVFTDTAMNALVEENNTLVHKLLVDSVLLTWSGENIGMPGVFSVNEDETNFESTIDEGSVSDSTDIVTKTFLRIFQEEYFPKSVRYKGKIPYGHGKSGDTILIDEDHPKSINIKYHFDTNARLLFGREHYLCYLPEYKNGYGLSFNGRKNAKGEPVELGYYDIVKNENIVVENDKGFIDFLFRRNESVKPVSFFLQSPLLEKKQVVVDGELVTLEAAAEGREGESLHHLVIRNYSKQADKEFNTHQKSVRHILPPPISFEHAFWHNKIFEMSTDASYEWYLKYHFPLYEADGHDYDEVIRGSTRMRNFYSKKCEVNYLPDPLTKGFRLEFFMDKDRRIPANEYKSFEQLEFYFTGTYPYINAWKIVVEEAENKKPLVAAKGNEITLRIEKGNEIFISARTILDPSYENLLETFGNYNEFTRYGGNDLLTPPLEFSVVHAMQRPLVKPAFHNLIDIDKDQDKTELTLTNTLSVEQLGIYKDKSGIVRYLEDHIPTGNLEVYAKWEQYTDDPNHLIDVNDPWDPNQPVNKISTEDYHARDGETPAVFETSLDFSERQLSLMEATLNKINNRHHPSENYAVDVQLNYDVKETKYLEKWYWIKNKSKFTAYYPGSWGNDDKQDASDEKGREIFNRISDKGYLVKVLNNRKPLKPVMASRGINLVSVTEDMKSGGTTYRRSSMNRLRLYFERGRLSSGKGERLGFIVNDPASRYNDYFVESKLVSTVGRDIVSDTSKPFDGLYRNPQVLLQKSNFVITDPVTLESTSGKKASDLESFYPEYVSELGMMTFIPKLDKKLNLWYLDVELDINDENGNELHNPFVRFTVVNYQPNSVDYNNGNSFDLKKDCRFSEPVNTGYVYIMGSRVMNIRSKFSWVEISLSYALSSLKGTPDSEQTKFYAVVEGTENDLQWFPVKDRDEKAEAFLKIPSRSESLLYYSNNKYKKFRVVILETEEWDKTVVTTTKDLLNSKFKRVVMVSVFDL